MQNVSSIKKDDIFEMFFHQSKDLVCIAGFDGYFKIINPAFEKVLGYTETELLSKPFVEFIHPDDIQKTSDEVNLMSSKGTSTIQFENRYIRKDGQLIHLQWNSSLDTENETIFAIARDISEKKIFEEKLERSEKLLKAAQSMVKMGSWSFDTISHEVFWTEGIYEIFEIDQEAPNTYELYLSRFNEQDLSILNHHVSLAIQSGKSYSFDHAVNLPDRRIKYVHCYGYPTKDKKGAVIKIEGVVQDITSSKIARDQLEKSERLLDETQSIAKTGSWSMDFSTGELYWSREMYKIYEIDPSIKGVELTNIFYSRFTDEERSNLNKLVEEALINGKPYISERYIQFPNGTKKWIRGSGLPVADKNGKITKIEGIAQDITESKLAELTILENIREKETLLKELHHRVKNNLQVISSMLNLQSSMIENEQVKSIFQDSQQRIKSMASIHDLLYKSTDLSEINFSDYIVNLINDAVVSYRGKDHDIHLEIDLCKDLLFQLELAVPLGLFVNEIITNSLKHGVKNSNQPIIRLSIKRGGTKNYILHLSDNGKGFDSTRKKNDTLGLLLIESLANQLEGNMTLDTGTEGTTYILEF